MLKIYKGSISGCPLDLTIGRAYNIDQRGWFSDDVGDTRHEHHHRFEELSERTTEGKEQEVEDKKEYKVVAIVNDDIPYLTEGRFYRITHFDWAGDPQILDDDGDEYDTEELDEDDTLFLKEGDELIAEANLMPGHFRGITAGRSYKITVGAEGSLSFVSDIGQRVDARLLIWKNIRRIDAEPTVLRVEAPFGSTEYKFRVESEEHALAALAAFDALGYKLPTGHHYSTVSEHRHFVAIDDGSTKTLLISLSTEIGGIDFEDRDGIEVHVAWMKPTQRPVVEVDGEEFDLAEVKEAIRIQGVEAK